MSSSGELQVHDTPVSSDLDDSGQVSACDDSITTEEEEKMLNLDDVKSELIEQTSIDAHNTQRMEELELENQKLTEKLQREASKSRKLKAKLKNKCNRLERQKQHHLKHCKHKSNCSCTFHQPMNNTNLKLMQREEKEFFLISNDGFDHRVDWAFTVQSSTVNLMLKRFNMAFNESKRVSLWLPNVDSLTMDKIINWFHVQDRPNACERILLDIPDRQQFAAFMDAADYFNLHKLRILCRKFAELPLSTDVELYSKHNSYRRRSTVTIKNKDESFDGGVEI